MIARQLKRARKASGLSLRALGEKVNRSHATIKKYEDGKSVPSSTILLELATALNIRMEYFFRSQTVNLEKFTFRHAEYLTPSHYEAILEKVTDQLERRLALEKIFPEQIIPNYKLDAELPAIIDDLNEIEDVAVAVRHAWNIGLDPISDLIEKLELCGIRIFVIDDLEKSQSRFDGLSATVNNIPLIVINNRFPGDRQRFTLSHELGHIILDARLSNNLDKEKACNRFAGAFLFPRRSVFDELGSQRKAIEMKELALLKEKFGLSMGGILHRLEELGIISSSYYQSMDKTFRANGWKKKEPGMLYPQEIGHVFEQMVFRALAEDYIGESKAAEFLNISLVKLQEHRLLNDYAADSL